MKLLIKNKDAFVSGIRRRKNKTRIVDLRKNHYNHIVCSDTGEVCRSYKEYLRSKHWELFKKRYKLSKMYTGKCFICSKHYGRTGENLHHITYKRVGHELLTDIVSLCRVCHRNVHKALKNGITWNEISDKVTDANGEQTGSRV